MRALSALFKIFYRNKCNGQGNRRVTLTDLMITESAVYSITAVVVVHQVIFPEVANALAWCTVPQKKIRLRP